MVITMPVNQAIFISDLHAGCQFGLCPPKVNLDGGGSYTQSALQAKIWLWWLDFRKVWVPTVTKGEPYILVVNGDTTDGRHHGAVTLVSNNLADQQNIAYEILAPWRDDPMLKELILIRGTECHVGPAAENEERLAQRLGAMQDDLGRSSRFEAWLDLDGCLVQVLHHIGATGSMSYETTALMKEYAEVCSEAARWNRKSPDVVVRSHRHRKAEIRVPIENGDGICFTTPGWQLKTPYVFRIPGGRISTPQFGGSLVRKGDRVHYTEHFVKTTERPPILSIRGK